VDEYLRRNPLVFVDDLGLPQVTEHDWRHLTRSLRLRPGAPIALGDGAGTWRPATITVDGIEVDGDVGGDCRHDPPRAGTTMVAFSPVKGDRTEWVVQKLTELGVDRIVVIETERSVVRWDQKRRTQKMAKLGAVAREAAMQCRSLWLPQIDGPLPLIDLQADGAGQWVMAEPGSHRLVTSDDRQIIIGPEGGFTPAELAGYDTVALPGNILRAETAALAAATVMVSGRFS